MGVTCDPCETCEELVLQAREIAPTLAERSRDCGELRRVPDVPLNPSGFFEIREKVGAPPPSRDKGDTG